MNIHEHQPSARQRGAGPQAAQWSAVAALAPVEIRRARSGDAGAIHALIAAHAQPGRLLPRTRDEVETHVRRFFVAASADEIVGCAELAPLGADLGEVRSLVVAEEVRGAGVGGSLTEAVIEAAARASFSHLCAFTHAPAFFVRLGFSLVPHLQLPEKIAIDCVDCPLFRVCGQYAVLLNLSPAGAGR
jgi:amino-acid N-acetyltransferase